jgi:hypothetical protein
MRAVFDGSNNLRAAGAHLARYAARESIQIATELEALKTSVAVLAEREIRSRTPVLTGALQRSTRSEVSVNRAKMELVVHVRQPAKSSDGKEYSRYVIEGTKYVRANDYPSRARPFITAGIHAELKAWGKEVRSRIRRVR